MKCTMCGESEGTIERENPNYGETDTWTVCESCDEYIDWGKMLAVTTLLEGHEAADDKIRERFGGTK